MAFARFAENRPRRRAGSDERVQIRVFFHLVVGMVRAPKRGDTGVFQVIVGDLLEKCHVHRIGTGPAAFDIVDAEFIKAQGDLDFIRGRQVDVFGLRAVACVRAQPDYDLIIMDIMMPGMDGVAACTEIRQHSVAPILFLTAKAQPGDMSDAYGSGGDDYLVKPFSNHELFLRVESLIRRYRVYHGKGDAPTVIDALEINRDKGTVCKNGRAVEMTKTEFELLQYLIANRGTSVSARKLYEDVWHEKFLPSSANTVMVHILKLRKKLEDDPSNPTLIRTVWGKGYQID